MSVCSLVSECFGYGLFYRDVFLGLGLLWLGFEGLEIDFYGECEVLIIEVDEDWSQRPLVIKPARGLRGQGNRFRVRYINLG